MTQSKPRRRVNRELWSLRQPTILLTSSSETEESLRMPVPSVGKDPTASQLGNAPTMTLFRSSAEVTLLVASHASHPPRNRTQPSVEVQTNT
jgi:hypothetical protein